LKPKILSILINRYYKTIISENITLELQNPENLESNILENLEL
jgi:hypothetical protein